MNTTRESWTGRLGFILATAGFAVGLGNIWRFPYVTGMNGGGLFLVVYLVIAGVIGVPLLVAEIGLGRKAQLTPIAGMWRLTGSRRSPWNLLSWLAILAVGMIGSYYVMLVGWILGYFVMTSSGRLAGASPEGVQQTFDRFISSPGPVLAYTLGVVLFMSLVVGRGLRNGLERTARLAMPALFLLLVALALRSVTFPGAMEGLAWYLKPDLQALSGGLVLAALGQAFYSIGIGMAAAFAFGSFLDPTKSDVPGNAAIVVLCDTAVAVLAGLVIFPALFAFDLPPDAGPSLLFVSMANLFAQMPAGALFGAAFFFLLLLAALTSTVAVYEVLTATLMDATGLRRGTANSIVGLGWAAAAVPVVLSQGPWKDVEILDRDIFTFLDQTSGNLLLPIVALLLALYTAFVWRFDRFRDDVNAGAGRLRVTALWRPLVVVVIPLAVLVVLLLGLGVVG